MNKISTMPNLSNNPMSVMDAIYHRRSVRDYTAGKVSQASIHMLMYAAIQAPTAMQEEPWAFAIIQDRELLDRLSETAKQTIWLQAQSENNSGLAKRAVNIVSDPGYNVFYNAGALIVIYGKPVGPFVAADCWLAAENLMLAACTAGIGTCVIGLAVPVLNSPEWKRLLDIPAEFTAYAPILLGYPAAAPPPSPARKPPELICWK
jgi:nitroreductase